MNQDNIDRAWEAYARSSHKKAGLASLENTLIGSVFPVHPNRLKPHQNDWPLLSMLLKYYLPQSDKDLFLKETLLAYAQEEKGNPTEWALMEKLLLGLPDTSLEAALSPEQWKITPWFHFNPDLAKNLMSCFSEHPEQMIQEALFFPFSQRFSVLNQKTVSQAFSHLQKEKTISLISYKPLTHKHRLAAIQSTINAIQQEPNRPFLREKLTMLLGIPVAKVKAQAAQYYFNPLSNFKRQLYWVILNGFQIIGTEQLNNPDSNASYPLRYLKQLIESLVTLNLRIFPELQAFTTLLMDDIQNKDLSPLAYLMLAYQSCRDEAFSFAENTLNLFPNEESDRLTSYSLNAIEFIAYTQEKSVYLDKLWHFFTKHPEQVPSFCQIFSCPTDSLTDLINHMANSPSLLDWQSIGRTLMESTTDEKTHQQLLEYGAYYPRSSETPDWSRLKNTLSVYVPQTAQDARFQEKMLTYCDLKNHEASRWSALMRALFLAKDTHTTFFEQAYQEALKTKKDYRWESRLLTMARECQDFSSEPIHHFFKTLSGLSHTLAMTNRLVPESPEIVQFKPLEHQNLSDWFNQLPTQFFFTLNLKQLDLTALPMPFQSLKSHRDHLQGLWLDEQDLHFTPHDASYLKRFSFNATPSLFLDFHRELPCFTHLEDLSLRRTGLTDVSFQYLLPQLMKLPLKRLDLSDNGLTIESFNALLDAKGRLNETLTTLNLSGNTISIVEGNVFHVFSFEKLDTIEWGQNQSISMDFKYEFDMYLTRHPSKPFDAEKWRYLHKGLERAREDSFTESLTNPSLFSLPISQEGQRTPSFSDNGSIREINTPSPLSNESRDVDLTPPSEALLNKVIQAIHQRTLRYVANENPITEDHFLDFLQCLKNLDANLTTIDLTGQTFSPEQFQQLMQTLRCFKSLKTLNLDNVKVKIANKINLVASFIKNHPSLEKVSLIGDEVIDNNLLKEIKKAVIKNTRFKVIELNSKADDMSAIHDLLKNRTLETIHEDDTSASQYSDSLPDLPEVTLPETALSLLPSISPSAETTAFPTLYESTVWSDARLFDERLSNASLEISYRNLGAGFMPVSTREVKRHYVVICEQIKKNQPHLPQTSNTANDGLAVNAESDTTLNPVNTHQIVEIFEDVPVEIFLVDYSTREPVVKSLTQQLTDFVETPLWLKLQTLKAHDRIESLTVGELNQLQDFLDEKALDDAMETFVFPTQSLHLCLDDTFDALMTEQKKILMPRHQYPKRHAFFHYLVQNLQIKLFSGFRHENSALAGGLDVADSVGTALSPTIWAKPVMTTVTSLARQMNTIERAAFHENLSSFYAVFESQPVKTRRFIECLALMILTRYVHEFEEYEMNPETAERYIETIIDYIGFGHTQQSPLIKSTDPAKNTYDLNKIDRLMFSLFGDSRCYFVIPKINWHRCMDALQEGVKISQSVVATPLPKSTYLPAHYRFSTANLDINLRAFEQHFRQAILTAIDNYHRQHHDVGYYGRLFVRYVKCHGGEKSFEAANQLAEKVKTLPFEALLREFLKHLQETHTLSRMNQYSLNSLLIDVLVGNVDEDSLRLFDEALKDVIAQLSPSSKESPMVENLVNPSNVGLFSNKRKAALHQMTQHLKKLEPNETQSHLPTVDFGS